MNTTNQEQRIELVKSIAETLTILIDSEVKRDKEEAKGLIRRDGGRVMSVYCVADMVVETVVARIIDLNRSGG